MGEVSFGETSLHFQERIEISKLIPGDETFTVIGAAIEVRRALGTGFFA